MLSNSKHPHLPLTEVEKALVYQRSVIDFMDVKTVRRVKVLFASYIANLHFFFAMKTDF